MSSPSFSFWIYHLHHDAMAAGRVDGQRTKNTTGAVNCRGESSLTEMCMWLLFVYFGAKLYSMQMFRMCGWTLAVFMFKLTLVMRGMEHNIWIFVSSGDLLCCMWFSFMWLMVKGHFVKTSERVLQRVEIQMAGACCICSNWTSWLLHFIWTCWNHWLLIFVCNMYYWLWVYGFCVIKYK